MRKIHRMTAVLLSMLILWVCAPQVKAGSQFTGASISFPLVDETCTVISYEHKECLWFFLPACVREGDATVTLSFSSGDVAIPVRLIPGEELVCSCSGKEYRFQTVVSSSIPALFIDVSENGGLKMLNKSKENVLTGSIFMTDAAGKTLYTSGAVTVKGRGNGSWKMPKKGYGIKLAEKADLLGMGKDRNWVLIPSYRDNSLLNFRIINDLALACGVPFAQESRYVDLYIDGDYRGVYLLTEKMEIDRNRIDITDLEKATEQVNTEPLSSFKRKRISNIQKTGASGFYWTISNDPEDITGGYLLEFDTSEKAEGEASRFGSDNGLTLSVKSPEYLTEAQLNYIAVFWQDFENALYSKTGYNKKGRHFTEYMDMESFAVLWLLDELGMEIDVCSSHYFWKDSDLTGDGKLHACAPWDVEHCFKREKFAFDYMSTNGSNRHFWRDMYNLHPEFQQVVKTVWQTKLYPALCQMMDIENSTLLYEGVCSYETYVSFIDPAARMNHLRWPQALSSQVDDRSSKTWDECVDYVRRYLTGRIAYMNTVYGEDNSNP